MQGAHGVCSRIFSFGPSVQHFGFSVCRCFSILMTWETQQNKCWWSVWISDTNTYKGSLFSLLFTSNQRKTSQTIVSSTYKSKNNSTTIHLHLCHHCLNCMRGYVKKRLSELCLSRDAFLSLAGDSRHTWTLFWYYSPLQEQSLCFPPTLIFSFVDLPACGFFILSFE